MKRKLAQKVVRRLDRLYGRPRFDADGEHNLVGHLVHTILSQKTTGEACRAAYDRLTAGRDWDQVAAMGVPRMASAIRAAGLAGQKAPRIRAILRQLKKEHGTITLEFLHDLSNAEARETLLALDGVGPKTADCVLMFGMGRQVLPVDTHVYRVTRRLGLLDEEVPLARASEALEEVVAPRDRYAMHVNLFRHGRAVCRSQRPRCKECCLAEMCLYEQQVTHLR